MSVVLKTVVLLVLSNGFMTFAWYAHRATLRDRPWFVPAFVSWGIALFEYLFQVPANRIGYTALSLPQLKILQEAITLTVFVPFAVLYMRQPVKLDYLWSGLCVIGAVYFALRKSRTSGTRSTAAVGAITAAAAQSRVACVPIASTPKPASTSP